MSRIWTWPFRPPCPKSGHGSAVPTGTPDPPPRRREISFEAEEVPGRPGACGCRLHGAVPAGSAGPFQPVEMRVQRCPRDLDIGRKLILGGEAAVVWVMSIAEVPEHELGGGRQPTRWIAQLVARWLIVPPPYRRAWHCAGGAVFRASARAASRGQPPSGRAPCARPGHRVVRSGGFPALQRVDREPSSSASSDRFSQPMSKSFSVARGSGVAGFSMMGQVLRVPAGSVGGRADPSTRVRRR